MHVEYPIFVLQRQCDAAEEKSHDVCSGELVTRRNPNKLLAIAMMDAAGTSFPDGSPTTIAR